MLVNVLTFRRQNFEMHFFNKIIIISMQSILNINFFLNWYVKSIDALIQFEMSKIVINFALIIIELNLQNINFIIFLNFYEC